MTQTIIKNKKEAVHSGVVVDIYANISGKEKYCYTSQALQFTHDDLASWGRDTVDYDNDLDLEDFRNMINLFLTKQGLENGFIWKCESYNGNDDHLEFFAKKQDAIDNIESQTC
jgi:hypothetical protein